MGSRAEPYANGPKSREGGVKAALSTPERDSGFDTASRRSGCVEYFPSHPFRPMASPIPPPGHPVVLFDGVCNLCNASVTFLIDRDSEALFRFAPLQSDVGQALVSRCELEGEDSIVLVEEDGRCYVRSEAALRIARRMDGAWPLLSAFLLLPRPLRDAAYRFIARNRYRWFGRQDACRLPTPDLRARFLDYTLP